MTADLTIYHNKDSLFFEFTTGGMFKPTDRLAKVIKLVDLPDELVGNVDKLLEDVFAQTNMPDPTQPWALAYRAAGHRSLSVGDVIQVGETAWAVANVGFQQVSIRAEQVINNRPADIAITVGLALDDEGDTPS